MKLQHLVTFALWICLIELDLKAQHQSEWQQKVNYSIRVTLDTANHALDGNIEIHYFNNSPSMLNKLYVHLWPNAYKDNQTPFAKQMALNGNYDYLFAKSENRGYIDSLKFEADGKFLSWVLLSGQEDIAVIALDVPLLTGQSIKISTPFHVKLPKVYSRSGYENGFYAVTQWYPKPAVFDVNGWNQMSYLNQGEFYSEYGDFNVEITVPNRYELASTGNLVQQSEKGGFTTYKYEESSIHDFAWFCSDSLIERSEYYVLPDGDTVVLEAYYQGDISEDVFKYMGKTLELYGEYIGKYPYKTCKLVIGPLEAGAGMEYPTITLCASDAMETIVHEVGHNWFYGIIGNNERQYPWMDESINSYFDKVVTNALDEKQAGDVIPDRFFYNPLSRRQWIGKHSTLVGIRQMTAMGTSQAINLSSAEYSYAAYGLVIYGRGPLAFAYLREQLGDDLFFSCFRNYFNEWKYRHPLPGDMQSSFEKTCGFPLGWFFKDILSDVNTIDYVSGKWMKNYKIKGSDSLSMYLKSKGTLSKDVNPNGFLAERSLYNNGQGKRLIRLSFPIGYPIYDRDAQVNIMPFMGYNIYDGFYPMLVINNSILNDRAIDYAFLPGYSFKRKSMNGWGKISYRYVSKKKRSYIETGLQGQSYGIEENSESNSYYRLRPYFKFHGIGGQSGVTRTEKTLIFQFIHTGLQNSTYISGKDSLGNNMISTNSREHYYNYYKATYKYEFKKLLSRIILSFDAEFGSNNKFNPTSYQYLKTWMNLKYRYQYKKGKYFKSEFYAGFFHYMSKSFANLNGQTIQSFYVSGNAGPMDYTRSELLFGRNENYFSQLLIGKQILDNGGIRNVVIINPIDKYSLTLRNSIDFPGKIPISFYMDFGYVRYTKQVIGLNLEVRNDLLYTGGVELRLLSDMFSIYIPVAYSNLFSSYNLVNQSFLNTIGFKLNLNVLEPGKLVKGLVLDNKFSLSE